MKRFLSGILTLSLIANLAFAQQVPSNPWRVVAETRRPPALLFPFQEQAFALRLMNQTTAVRPGTSPICISHPFLSALLIKTPSKNSGYIGLNVWHLALTMLPIVILSVAAIFVVNYFHGVAQPAGQKLEHAPPAVRCLFVDWTGTLYDPETRSLIPGSLELLRRIKAAGIYVSVLSYGQDDEMQKAVRDLGLGDWVDHVRGRRPGESNTPGHKARIIQQQLAELNLSPAEAALLGDLPQDMEDGNQTGVFKIARILPGVDRAPFELQSPDLILTSYGEPDGVVRFLTELAPMQFNQRGYEASAARFAGAMGEDDRTQGGHPEMDAKIPTYAACQWGHSRRGSRARF